MVSARPRRMRVPQVSRCSKPGWLITAGCLRSGGFPDLGPEEPRVRVGSERCARNLELSFVSGHVFRRAETGQERAWASAPVRWCPSSDSKLET
jgi:hypothetical protein